jgi:hypothetical protein
LPLTRKATILLTSGNLRIIAASRGKLGGRSLPSGDLGRLVVPQQKLERVLPGFADK